jgi:hypothetical protein
VNALCVPFQDTAKQIGYACQGKVTTGLDQDDAIMQIGDQFTRFLSPLTDVDLFQVSWPVGKFVLMVTPLQSNDVAFDIYDANGELYASVNEKGEGQAEGITITSSAANGFHEFIVVKNAGKLAGQYRISITPSP